MSAKHTLKYSCIIKRNLFNLIKNQRSVIKRFSDRRLVGYSKEQVYNVVANVEAYKLFLPLCTNSSIRQIKKDDTLIVDLSIGYSPLFTQTYCSLVTLEKPNFVKAECYDDKLFNHLKADWQFQDGLPDDPQTCSLDFKVEFEFKSKLYGQMVDEAFDKIVIQVVNSFLNRARYLYGRPKAISSISINRWR